MVREPPTEARNSECSQEVATSRIPLGRCRTKLDSIRGILKELGRLYRAGRSGTISVNDAAKLGFLLSVMARIHADAIFEERLDRVERTNAKS